MNEGVGRNTSGIFTIPLRKRKQAALKQDYKSKLWKTRACAERDAEGRPSRPCPYADQVRHVVATVDSGVAFQSLAVASLQTLRGVIVRLRHAADASISLAQGEKLEEMIHTSESTAEAIIETLDQQGNRMLNLSAGRDTEDGERSWWFALTETIEAIEDGTKQIVSLASGQPKGAAGRRLSAIVVHLLRRQHQQLLAEADAWIS